MRSLREILPEEDLVYFGDTARVPYGGRARETLLKYARQDVRFLQTFDLRLNLVSDSQNSILAMVAGWITPIFAPLGFGDWRVSSALISGFMAKESVVSVLTVLFGSTQALAAAINPPSAAALLVFCLLYTPCVAAIASIKRELGGKWALGIVLLQCGIAWGCAFIVRAIAILFLAPL